MTSRPTPCAVRREAAHVHQRCETNLRFAHRLLQSRQENEEAKSVYARVLDQDPDNEDIYLLLGNLYIADQQWDQAFEVFDKFVQRFPNAYAGHFFFG